MSTPLYILSVLLTGDSTERGRIIYHALCWCLLLTGTFPGGGQPCFSLNFLHPESCPFSSPDILPGGGGLFYFIFLVGTFSSPETLPEGGQLCFSSTLPRVSARGTNAQLLWLSLPSSAPMHLDMTNSTSASTVLVETFTVNTSRLTGILPHLEDNQQLEMCSFANVDARVSTSMLVVSSLGAHSRPRPLHRHRGLSACPFPRDAVKMWQPPIPSSFPFALRNLPPASTPTLEHSAKYSWAMCKCSDRRCRQLVVRRLDSTATSSTSSATKSQ